MKQLLVNPFPFCGCERRDDDGGDAESQGNNHGVGPGAQCRLRGFRVQVPGFRVHRVFWAVQLQAAPYMPRLDVAG